MKDILGSIIVPNLNKNLLVKYEPLSDARLAKNPNHGKIRINI